MLELPIVARSFKFLNSRLQSLKVDPLSASALRIAPDDRLVGMAAKLQRDTGTEGLEVRSFNGL